MRPADKGVGRCKPDDHRSLEEARVVHKGQDPRGIYIYIYIYKSRSMSVLSGLVYQDWPVCVHKSRRWALAVCSPPFYSPSHLRWARLP